MLLDFPVELRTVSADMAHGLHPNFPERHEERHQPRLHQGFVVKHNANQRYATNLVSSLLFKQLAARHSIPCQVSVPTLLVCEL